MSKEKAPKEVCNLPGCDAVQYAAGVCREHHEQNYTLGCSEKLRDGSDCDRPIHSKGKCMTHYMRKYRKKNGKAAPEQTKEIRGYGQARFDVFTRIPQEAADIILKAAGRKDGMYEKANEILVSWAKRRERAEHAG